MTETEVAIYAKLNNIPSFVPVMKEEQEQHELKMVNNGIVSTMRVRKSTIGNKVDYTWTMKHKLPDNKAGNTEINTPIDELRFKSFIPFASRHVNKTRYTYLVEKPTIVTRSSTTNDRDVHILDKLYLELDVFPGTDWVKIDIELDEAMKQLPKEKFDLIFSRNFFIFDIKEYYISTDPNAGKKISSIWDEILGSKNGSL